MPSDSPAVGFRRECLIAAAGFGKTHAIAVEICKATGRHLILTHTNAGVAAIQTRLRQLGVDKSKVVVTTISSWALRYATCFPIATGLALDKDSLEVDWGKVFEAVARLVRSPPVSKIVQASYSGFVVDEYQDCTQTQHALVVALSTLLPCAIYGDPMQGIFSFGSRQATPMVEWPTDVADHFSIRLMQSEPFRWKASNPELGTWLLGARVTLLRGNVLDLSRNLPSSVRWVRCDSPSAYANQARDWCFRMAGERTGERALVLYEWEQQCEALARCLNGSFQIVETAECPPLCEFGRLLDTTEGTTLITTTLEFACLCHSRMKQIVASTLKSVREGRTPAMRSGTVAALKGPLSALMTSRAPGTILNALSALGNLDGCALYRAELWHEMLASIRDAASVQSSIAKTAVSRRSHRRIIGRKLPRLTVGRPPLVKGLECDHVLVANASQLKLEDLYVALSRATRTITILAGSPTLQPKARKQSNVSWLANLEHSK